MKNKTKGKIARFTCAASFLTALGTIGGIEHFSISPLRGALWISGCLLLAAVAGMKGGLL